MSELDFLDDVLSRKADELDEFEKRDLESQVVVPEDAGSALDMLGMRIPLLGGLNTPAQTAYIRDLIDREQRKDPQKFLEKFGKKDFLTGKIIGQTGFDAPTAEAERRLFKSITTIGGVFTNPTDVLPDFDEAKFEELADTKNQTALFAERRRNLLARAGKDGALGARITNMYDNGLDTAQTFAMLQANDDEEIDQILRQNFGREARLLSPIQVGVDADGKPVYEKIYQKEEGGQVFRLQVYDDFTDLRTFALDTLKAARGDEQAQDRLSEFFQSSGAGTIENLASPEVVLPMLAYAIFPQTGAASLGLQFATFLGRGIAAGVAQTIGQATSRAMTGLDTTEEDINLIDALIEGGIASFGPPGFRQIKKLFVGGDGVLQTALQKAASAKADSTIFKDIARDLGEDVSLPTASILLRGGIAGGFVRGILGFAPEKAQATVEKTGGKIHDKIVDRIVRLRQNSKLTQNDLTSLANSYRIDFNDALEELNALTFSGADVGSAGVAAAKAARANLQGVLDSMRNNATSLYDTALNSAKSKDAKLEGELAEIIENRLVRLQELSKRLQNPRTVGQQAPETIDAIPEGLSQYADLIQRIDSLAKASKSPITGERTSVLNQIHGLKQRLEQESLAGGPVDEIKAMNETLEEMLNEVGASISFRDTTAGNMYELARAIYGQQSSMRKTDYVLDQLSRGNNSPLQTLIDPLLSGAKTFDQETLVTLKNLADINPQAVAEGLGLKPSMASSARAATGGEPKTLAGYKKDFFNNLTLAFKARMSSSKNQAGELRQMLGVEDLTSVDADNEILRLVLPNKADRKLYLDTALEQERSERKARLFSDAVRESLTGNMVSEDVTNTFVRVMQREYAKSNSKDLSNFFKDALNRFPDTQKSGLERALPQVQAELLEKILLTGKKSKLARTPGGRVILSTLDMEQVTRNIQDMQDDDFAREFLDWTFSQNTGLKGVQDIKNLVDTIQEVGQLLGETLPGGAESLATAGLAQDPVKRGFKPVDYIYRILATKNTVNLLLNPVSRKRLETILNSQQLANRKAEMVLYYLQSNARNYEDKQERLIAIDDNFYSLENYRGPKRDEIFKRYEDLRKRSNVIDRLRGDDGDDVITGSNVNLPRLQSAPIPSPMAGLGIPAAPATPSPVAGLGIPAVPATGGRGIAALPAPETVQQLQQVGLDLFGGTRG